MSYTFTCTENGRHISLNGICTAGLLFILPELKNFILVLAFLFLFLSQTACQSNKNGDTGSPGAITFPSLLREMADRDALRLYPAYRLKQASSYDRTETNPADPATWFNNKDYGNYIREEMREGRTEYVILEENNPGCIVRWWIPLEETYKNRIVRIYLDGNNIPVIEENYHDFMSGKSFIPWPYAFISSDEKDSLFQAGLPVGHPKQMGADMYLPIPFSKSCKITLDDNPFYYVIDYRVYPIGTKIKSFSREAFSQNKSLIDSTGKIVTGAGECEMNNPVSGNIMPGEDLILNLPEGQNAIYCIQIKVDPAIDKKSLRSLVLQAVFDNEECIWCPVSEFFGEGVYIRHVSNRNNTVKEDGTLQSYWVMPYRKSSVVRLKNYGNRTIRVELNVSTKALSWQKESMYFHTGWHEDAPVKTSSPIDWNYIKIEGRGVYAGDVLTVHSFSKGWWGEGDEKIYIDNDSFPSHLGTGLEDYYGYAWGMAHQFSSPFISLPLRDARGKADWRGYTTVSRMRILDGIPFEQKLNFNIEAWLHDSTVSYSVAVFWYGFPSARSNIQVDSTALRRVLPDFKAEKMKGSPGKKYPDPSAIGPVKAKGNGKVKHVGNHPDLIGWQNIAIPKPLDADHDNIYGTAGYYLFNGKILDARNIKITADSVPEIPYFVEDMVLNGSPVYSMQDAWLKQSGNPDLYHITGGMEVSGKGRYDKMLATIRLGKNVPESFRLGIMCDNLDHFNPPDQTLQVKSSREGDSGPVPLARSNRIPDWYFFQITNASPGEEISIFLPDTGRKRNAMTIGGLTFDIQN